MMTYDMKKNELNELEMENVTGGDNDIVDLMKATKVLEQRNNNSDLDEKFCEAASTAWQVVKYAFELCG